MVGERESYWSRGKGLLKLVLLVIVVCIRIGYDKKSKKISQKEITLPIKGAENSFFFWTRHDREYDRVRRAIDESSN